MIQVILQLFRYKLQFLKIELIRPSSRIRDPAATTSFGGLKRYSMLSSGARSKPLDVNGVRTSYLVRWRGYPSAWVNWVPRAQLIADVLGLVEQYDETHPLRLKKGRRKTTSRTRVQGFQIVNPFGHLGRNALPPVGIVREKGLPRGTPVQLVSHPDWITLLTPDASCIKFTEPGLTDNAFKVMDEGIPSFHQGFSVSNTVVIVPPMLENASVKNSSSARIVSVLESDG
uniref:Chromo domain-containing protein n=1 Tax=Peronospora matthiolae TaxID=2874970 RepID=A0AAV1U2T1_9STRA